jgi:hypothetical protein
MSRFSTEWERRGQRIPGSKPTEVKGHGITYKDEQAAEAASFTYAAYLGARYTPTECLTCGGWHLERIGD